MTTMKPCGCEEIWLHSIVHLWKPTIMGSKVHPMTDVLAADNSYRPIQYGSLTGYDVMKCHKSNQEKSIGVRVNHYNFTAPTLVKLWKKYKCELYCDLDNTLLF
jgi:hypothetical protein